MYIKGMNKIKNNKFSITKFNKQYPDDNTCLHGIFLTKYSGDKECHHCHKPFRFYKVAKRKCYECSYCGYQVHPLANTIFHKSSTPLKSWFFAIYLFSVSKNGVSAKELERQLGVTYKCAYRMGKQIRKLFDENINPLENIVEMDETYYGAKESNKHKHKRTAGTQGRSNKTKTPVIGVVEREGSIIAKVVEDTTRSTVKQFAKKHIKLTAMVKTDEYMSYRPLKKMGYKHDCVIHGLKQYVKGNTHTNNLEGFWSQLKRSVNGTYHSVSSKYLQTYVNEFAYRYNRRKQKDPIFYGIISKAAKLS